MIRPRLIKNKILFMEVMFWFIGWFGDSIYTLFIFVGQTHVKCLNPN